MIFLLLEGVFLTSERITSMPYTGVESSRYYSRVDWLLISNLLCISSNVVQNYIFVVYPRMGPDRMIRFIS